MTAELRDLLRKNFGVWRAGGGWWVGRSAARVPRGGSVGTPTYIPQNDPHDALIILNIQKWGKKNFQEKFAHWLRLPPAKVRPGGQVRDQKFFCVFQTFLNSPQNSEYFEYRHIPGRVKKKSPQEGQKKFSAPLAPTLSPKISNWRKTGSKTLGGSGGWGGGGSGIRTGRPPWATHSTGPIPRDSDFLPDASGMSVQNSQKRVDVVRVYRGGCGFAQSWPPRISAPLPAGCTAYA